MSAKKGQKKATTTKSSKPKATPGDFAHGHWTEAQWLRFTRTYLKLMSAEAIADELGMTKKQVFARATVARRRGAPLPPFTRLMKMPVAAMREIIGEGEFIGSGPERVVASPDTDPVEALGEAFDHEDEIDEQGDLDDADPATENC